VPCETAERTEVLFGVRASPYGEGRGKKFAAVQRRERKKGERRRREGIQCGHRHLLMLLLMP